jgi:uncharacterized protein (TIGR01777 family)
VRIVVSGSTGLIGSALVAALVGDGHEVVALVRSKPRPGEIEWNPSAGMLDPGVMDGFDAVVHLAGENIAGGRWTAEKKQRIRDSRVQGTALLAGALSRVTARPRVLVSASAVGYYGDRGEEMLDESSPPGSSFLSGVCKAWEDAARPAADAGIRTVQTRLGVVLSPRGGALKEMLTPFKLGAGGVIGSGRQYWSWVSLQDVIGAMRKAIDDAKLSGPVNVVSPNPVTCRQFVKTLGKVLSRPTVVPMPAFAARAAFGEMADELFLASARVVPRRLQEQGYPFAHPHLEPALRDLLGRA